MNRKGNKILDCGYEVLTLSELLTSTAKIKLATRIIHSENVFLAVEKLLSSAHIKDINNNLDNLQTEFNKYKTELFDKQRKGN